MDEQFKHKTVLLNEATEVLDINPNGIYVDATLGGGGHTKKILSKLESGNGKLFSFDQDIEAINFNQNELNDSIQKGKLTLIHSNFSNLSAELLKNNVRKISGIIYDLGVSSVQFDKEDRGFSYRFDSELDMRMDTSNSLTAKEIVNEWPYSELVRIFFRYGEDKFSKNIARNIERLRKIKEIDTTFQLVEIIRSSIPAKELNKKGHPAKKIFQALRIAVNDELGVLEESLKQAFELVSIRGRISIISFQSLEDRLVKQMFLEQTEVKKIPSGIPIKADEQTNRFIKVTKKPILPSDDEIETNRRSHSAKLRVIEKVKEK